MNNQFNLNNQKPANFEAKRQMVDKVLKQETKVPEKEKKELPRPKHQEQHQVVNPQNLNKNIKHEKDTASEKTMPSPMKKLPRVENKQIIHHQNPTFAELKNKYEREFQKEGSHSSKEKNKVVDLIKKYDSNPKSVKKIKEKKLPPAPANVNNETNRVEEQDAIFEKFFPGIIAKLKKYRDNDDAFAQAIENNQFTADEIAKFALVALTNPNTYSKCSQAMQKLIGYVENHYQDNAISRMPILELYHDSTEAMRKLFKHITFKLDSGEQIPLPKIVLQHISPFFTKMFKADDNESRQTAIPLKGVSKAPLIYIKDIIEHGGMVSKVLKDNPKNGNEILEKLTEWQVSEDVIMNLGNDFSFDEKDLKEFLKQAYQSKDAYLRNVILQNISKNRFIVSNDEIILPTEKEQNHLIVQEFNDLEFILRDEGREKENIYQIIEKIVDFTSDVGIESLTLYCEIEITPENVKNILTRCSNLKDFIISGCDPSFKTEEMALKKEADKKNINLKFV